MEVSSKKLVFALGLVFILGVLFAVVNGYYVETEGSNLPLIVYLISLLSIIIGAVIVFLFQWKLNKIQINNMLKLLPNEESILIKILIENNNAIEQNKLVAHSGFNKVKVSRIITVLENRGVIKKSNLGNTNMIVLKI